MIASLWVREWWKALNECSLKRRLWHTRPDARVSGTGNGSVRTEPSKPRLQCLPFRPSCRLASSTTDRQRADWRQEVQPFW